MNVPHITFNCVNTLQFIRQSKVACRDRNMLSIDAIYSWPFLSLPALAGWAKPSHKSHTKFGRVIK